MAKVSFYEKIDTNPKAVLMRIGENLKQTYQYYRPIHELIAQYIMPTRSQFLVDDSNKGPMINKKILDSTATQAVRTLKSGMLAGITPPSRKWFALSTGDREMNEQAAVKIWLDAVTRLMHESLLKTTFYSHVQPFYGDIGTFGTGAIYVEESFEKVATFMSLPIGSFFLGVSPDNIVNKFYREFSMTTAQIVEKFAFNPDTGEYDWTNISDQVKTLFESRNYEQLIYVAHLIQPNEDYIPGSPIDKNKMYCSYYYEMGGVSGTNSNPGFLNAGDNKLLRKKGYSYFPVITARWEVKGQDTYDVSCPGYVTIGDVMQLQRGESKTLMAIDKMIDPAMVGNPSLKNQKSSTLPGDITYLEENQMAQFRPAYMVNFSINEMEMKQDQVRTRIKKGFYEDLFLMLANSDRRQITAREIEERHEEKLLALGPVLENLNTAFDQLIDIFFTFMLNQGLLPEVPEELNGVDLKIEYVSIMAQAQRSIGISQIEKVTNYIATYAPIFPNMVKKFNEMEAVDEYAMTVGLTPNLIRSDEDVQAMIEGEQQAIAEQQALMKAESAAKSAQMMSQTQTSPDSNALSDIIAAEQGY